MAKIGAAILRACAAAAIRRPWAILAVCLLLTIAAALAARTLTVDTGVDGILAADLPFRQVEERYRAAFPEDELAIVVVDAPSTAAARRAADALTLRLAARPALFSDVAVVGDSPFFDENALLFVPLEQIESIGVELRRARRLMTILAADPSLRGVARLLALVAAGVAEGETPPEAAALLARLAETVERRAAGEPAATPWSEIFGLEAAGRARRLVQAKPTLDDASLDRAGPALAALFADMAAVEAAEPGAELRATGLPVLRQQELNDVFSGALAASGLSFALVMLSLVLGIRSGRLIAALLITLVVGSIWTTGLAAVTVGRLNLISVAFLVLFFGLGVDFGTHLGLRHLEEARKGRPFGEALTAAMLGEGAGIGLSALCAALAFLAFVPTSYVGLAEFGIISALGMAVAVVATFTVQPALMALMPPRPKPGSGVTFAIGGWIERRRGAILAAAAVLTVAASFLAVRARLDVDPLGLQNPDAEAVVAYRELADDPSTSPYALNVVAPDREAARALAARLAAAPGVADARWIESFVPADQPARLAAIETVRERMGAAFLAESPPEPPPDGAALRKAFADIERSAADLAQAPEPQLGAAAGRLREALENFAAGRGVEPAALGPLGEALAGGMPPLVADLRARLSVARPVAEDDLPPELRADWVRAREEFRVAALPAEVIRSPADMAAFTKAVQRVAPGASGIAASITGAGEAIAAAFRQAILYTVVAIATVVAVLRRRIADVVLVLAPLALAAIWTLAASAALDLPFNFANIIVIPLLIGLGVAGSIHIVVRSREAHEAGADRPGDPGVLGTSTPLAVLIAQLNTVAAFATLAVSRHMGLRSMGILLGLAIFFVLVACLVVLPAFMSALAARRRAPAAPPRA